MRRVARAQDDGFESDLVPGIRASADAALLADELAFAAARLQELRTVPPGLFGQAASLGRDVRREEALWLVAQAVAIGPREAWQGESTAAGAGIGAEPDGGGLSPADAEDPFAAIAAAAVPWAGDALPDIAPELRGPRGCADPAATLAGLRTWAQRAGGLAPGLEGDASWTAQRRFDRAFERLALPGLVRGPRYDLLVIAGALGLVDVEPASLHLLADQRDPVLAAAKRVFGFGDPLVLARRASELAMACALPIAALDLGLLNWARRADDAAAGRITLGSAASGDPDARALVAGALEIGADGEATMSGEADVG